MGKIKYAVMELKGEEGYMLSEFDTFEEANKEALKCLSEEYSRVEKQDYRNGWRFAVESYVFDEDGNATEYLETHEEYDVCEYYDKMRIKGRVYEIRKSSANIKDIANINEGCVFDQQGYKTEILKKFSELEDAEMALRKYESTAKWINSTVGWEVGEYYIEESWYDENEDWFDGNSLWGFAQNNFEAITIHESAYDENEK